METGRLESRDIVIEVHIIPTIVEIGPGEGTENKEIEVTEGEEAKLTCRAEASPKSYYSWMDPKSRNVSDRYGYIVNRETGDLVISKVNKDTDSGNFRCIAENHAGSSTKDLYVNIITKPLVTSFLNISAAERTNTKLECRAAGNPLPDLMIRRDGSPDRLENQPERIALELTNDRNEAVLSVQLFQIERSDDGLYYCTASNRAGKVEGVGHLEVQYPPDMSLNPSVVKTWENHEINITCIANAVPNATITWYNSAGSSLAENYRYRIFNYPGRSLLAIDPRQPDAWGSYKCKAVNIHGEGSSLITLEQAFPPQAILSASVIKESPQSITFRFEGPDNTGGLPITKFHVVYFEDMFSGMPEGPRRHSWPVNPRNTYTLNDLRPQTRYSFRFAAQNDAGIGPEGAEIKTELPNESQPEKVNIIHESNDCCSGDINSRYSQNYLLRWTEPSNNGRAIESYDIKYYKVRSHNLNVLPSSSTPRSSIPPFSPSLLPPFFLSDLLGSG